MSTIPLPDLDAEGTSAPLTDVPDHTNFEPSADLGASRYRHTFPGDRPMDALLVNAGSDILIVTFHGALNRQRFTLPRFERIRTTAVHGKSMMFFADPTIWADPTFELGWYTGWRGQEIQPIIASWAVQAAKVIGATRIIFSGSSGGGFAALQVSALVPGSLCLAFNPSTSIHGYLAGGTSYGTQRKYIEVLYPEKAGGDIWAMDFTDDWAADLGDRMSVRKRYSTPRENYVIYASNVNDFHHELDLPALTQAMERAGTRGRLRIHTYDGPDYHTPPSPAEFREAMEGALAWCAELPPSPAIVCQ